MKGSRVSQWCGNHWSGGIGCLLHVVQLCMIGGVSTLRIRAVGVNGLRNLGQT